jgi:hypothetical protein
MFHTYYLQLKHVIESFPWMTLDTLYMYRPLEKFHADWHFIYITAHRDKSKDDLQSYYKLTNEDMQEITKEWLAEFLVPVKDAKLSDPNTIESPLVTQTEYDGPSNTKKKNKKE